MGQPRSCSRLALETTPNHPLPRQDLDRHVALQPLVAGQPDGSEGAGAEAAVQPVAIEDSGAGAGSGGGPTYRRLSVWRSAPDLGS